MRRSLRVFPAALDRIEIPVPCEVPWDSMAGDDQVRHCGACRQNVYNVASLTRPEALRLLEARAGHVCLRIFRRPDGTVLTADCRDRLRAARKRGLLVFAGVLVVVLWAQICAQIVGLIGLRRVLDGGVTGEVALVNAPVPPPPPMMGAPVAPPPAPLLVGKPVLGERMEGGLPPRMGHSSRETKGRIKSRP
jgi:hypothetical protein